MPLLNAPMSLCYVIDLVVIVFSELVQGSQLLGLWLGNANPCGTNGSNTENPNSVLIQVRTGSSTAL